jgi:hypothetical protein
MTNDFCAGDSGGRAGDLAHYAPGDHFLVVDIGGVYSFHAGNVPKLQLASIREVVGLELRPLDPGETYPRSPCRLPRNRTGMLILTVDTEAPLYDSTRPLARPSHGRGAAQRHPGRRSALGRPHPPLIPVIGVDPGGDRPSDPRQ